VSFGRVGQGLTQFKPLAANAQQKAGRRVGRMNLLINPQD
jgi:hypothetical protein